MQWFSAMSKYGHRTTAAASLARMQKRRSIAGQGNCSGSPDDAQRFQCQVEMVIVMARHAIA